MTLIFVVGRLLSSCSLVNGYQAHGMCSLALILREPNSENCLDLVFVTPPFEKVILVPDRRYISSAIK